MKAFTDLEQSKKLAESADMYYRYNVGVISYYEEAPRVVQVKNHFAFFPHAIPCWSVVALLDVLPNCTDIVKEEADTENEKYMCTVGIKDDIISTFSKTSIDACYEMILKLHELNLL
jgi:hypothetical protein